MNSPVTWAIPGSRVVTEPGLPAGGVPVTPGSGATIATDRVSERDYQQVKLMLGGAGQVIPLIQGPQAAAQSLSVTWAEDSDPLGTVPGKAFTSAVNTVPSSVAPVQLLPVNAARLGATVFNGANVPLYLKLGTGAALASFTVKLVPEAYYEVPFGFAGEISGIWAAGPVGNAQVTELS